MSNGRYGASLANDRSDINRQRGILALSCVAGLSEDPLRLKGRICLVNFSPLYWSISAMYYFGP